MTDQVDVSGPNQQPPELSALTAGPGVATPPSGAPGELQRASGGDLDEHHWSFADFHEDYISRYIALADAKAGACFAAASGLVVFLFNDPLVSKALTQPEWSWNYLVYALACLGLGVCAALSFWVIAPRTPRSGIGIVFWQDVAQQPSSAAFISSVERSSQEELTRQKLSHCYDVARVCASKYFWLRYSMRAGAVGLVATIAMLAIRQLTTP